MKIKYICALCFLSAVSLYGCSKSNGQVPAGIENADNLKKGYDLDEAALSKAGFKKVFEDDFSGSLDKWKIWEGGAYNNEMQLYRKENLKVANGNLVIIPKKEQVRGKTYPESDNTRLFSYTSGRIESKYTFAPGDTAPKVRISARIQLPFGAGMWPAFWTYGNDWPTKGEIDILEALGDRYHFTTDYFYGKTQGKVDNDDALTVKSITSASDLTTVFHVYEVIWTKTSLTFLLDGKVVDEKRSDLPGGEFISSFYNKMHSVVLNLAVGGDIFGKDFDPATIKIAEMHVDWVRVYTSK